MRSRHFSGLFALLAISACGHVPVSVPNVKACHVIGTLAKCAAEGVSCAACGETQTAMVTYLTFDGLIEMLEAQQGHGPAVIMPAEEWSKMETALEEACRSLGKYCTKEVQDLLNRLKAMRR